MDLKRGNDASIELAFDGFGRDSLTAEAEAVGGCVASLLQLAVRHYRLQLDRDRLATRVPRFARSQLSTPQFQIGLELDEDELALVTSEAERQGLAPEQLLAHAALLYLADADARRAAAASLV